MYAANTDNKYTRWLNSLPAAKNIAGQTRSNTKQNTVTAGNNNGASQDSVSVNVNKILYSGQVVQSSIKNYSGQPMTEYELFPSSDREYTVQDAIEYQYNRQFTINLDDVMSGNYENIKLRDPSQKVPEKFIEGLQQNGIQEEGYDWFRADFYIKGLSDSGDIKHAVEYLASGYAVARQHIEDYFTGEEKAGQFERLESAFREAMEKKAGELADDLGGFFQENGVGGETQKIYDSVMKAYSDSVLEYSDYIGHNRDYAGLEGSGSSWLKKDDSYMAGQLRKSMASGMESVTEVSGQYYTLDELGKTKEMVDEIKKYMPGSSDGRYISVGLSEEDTGVRLTELALKGKVFDQCSDVSQELKNAVTGSIDNMIREMPDRLNQSLEKEGMGKKLDQESIRKVYSEAMSECHGLKDIVKALRKAVAAGKKQYEEKMTDGAHTGTWNYGKNGYEQWLNSFSAMEDSWNKFVSEYSTDPGLLLSRESFSSYA